MANTKSTPDQVKFGKRVRELRLKLGKSQEDLSFDSGLDRTYISGVERGVRNPTLGVIKKIAEALRVGLEKLFLG